MATNSDIFNEVISERNRETLKKVFERRQKREVFEKVEKELPTLVRSYVKQQTKKIQTLSPREITDLVEKAISKLPEPKPTEKVIEKTIVKQVEKKDARKYVEESDLKDLKDQIDKLKEKLDGFKRDPDVRIVGNMLPNYSAEQGTFLKAQGNNLVWAAASSNGGADANPFYIGDSTTEGSWRFYNDGTNLLFQRLESGTWVEKGSMLA